MSVHAGQVRIKRAATRLVAQWQESRSLWRDDVAQRFEDEQLAPLLSKIRAADAALSHMTRVLEKVRRDCD